MMNTKHANKLIKKRLRRECKCSLHSPNDSRTHDVKTGRECPKRFIGRLIEKGYFTAKRRFICQECLDRYGCDAHDTGSFYGVTSPPKYDLNITNHAEMPQPPLSPVITDDEANETNSGINPEHIMTNLWLSLIRYSLQMLPLSTKIDREKVLMKFCYTI